jgi:hypothetical protein
MIADVATQLVGCWLLVLSVLHLINYHWFKRASEASVTIVFLAGQLIVGLLHGLVLAIPTVVRGALKVSVVGVSLVALVIVYLITFVVPYIGQYTLKIQSRMESNISTSLLDRALSLRQIMVRIAAKHNDHDLAFEECDQYREELTRVKQRGKTRLDTGETVLSVVLSAILLGGTVSGVDIFQQTVYQYSISTVIEIWLLIIAVSIIYRSTVLDLIAYSGDAEFESPDEMDAALSYQKGVSLHGYFQVLASGLLLAFMSTRISNNLMEELLEKKYTGEPWVRTAFKRLLN